MINAIETQARAVNVPIPCEIIKAGGITIASGLKNMPKYIFNNCEINKSPIIRRICLEFNIGFSFLEMKIKIMLQASISKNVIKNGIMDSKFKAWLDINWYEDIIEIKTDIVRIINLSILEKFIGVLFGNWVLSQKSFKCFIDLVLFCTEYK